MEMHECPVAGCCRRVPAHILMCRQHWAIAPRSLQRQVYAAWNGGAPTEEYPKVRAAAIAAADRQLGAEAL